MSGYMWAACAVLWVAGMVGVSAALAILVSPAAGWVPIPFSALGGILLGTATGKAFYYGRWPQ